MELRVLGPLEVRVGDDALPLGTRKQQVALASLIMYANRPVPVEDLIDELWPDGPPQSALANVNSYTAGLRRLLRSDGRSERLTRTGGGIQLNIDDAELDLAGFETETRLGRRAVADGDLDRAAALLGRALDRWAGPLFTGLPRGPLVTARAVVVEEDHLLVAEQLADVHLRRREPGRAVAVLRGHVAAHPLRERMHSLLIRGLYLSGDVSGALAAYASARNALVDELGVEPGEDLRRLHRAMLNRDITPDPGTPGALPVKVGAGGTTPHELPPEVGHFVGRAAELRRAREVLLPGPAPSRRRPAVLVLYGRGGVGKSAIAIQVSHDVADRFPDGQLYVDLLGATPGLRPLTPLEVLARLLGGLGVPAGDVPSAEAVAGARFRTATAGRRILFVFDNAVDAHQVSPLLPAAGGCAVVVTGRRPMPTVDADAHLLVGGLPAPDGITLFQSLVATAVDRDVAARVVACCDDLPLAVRIAAGRLVGRPDLLPEELAERLADSRQRLDVLELDGLAVRACIRIGYEALASSTAGIDQAAVRAFHALGLLNAPDVQPGVVAAMLEGQDLLAARRALDHLVDAQLLEPDVAGRYRLHDLVRLFAAELAGNDPAELRTRALRRGLAYYIGNR